MWFNSKELTDWKDETKLIPVWIKCSHAAGGYAMLCAVGGWGRNIVSGWDLLVEIALATP